MRLSIVALTAFVAGLLGAASWSTFKPTAAESPPALVAEGPASAVDLAARIEWLESRVAERPLVESPRSPVKEAAGRSDEVLALRLTKLESRLAELERIATTGGLLFTPESDPIPTSLDELQAELRELRRLGNVATDAQRERLIELTRTLLERYPDKEAAWLDLDRLVGLQILLGVPDEAEAEINRFASAIGLESWREASMRGAVAGQSLDYEGARQFYNTAATDPSADEPARADAAFWAAYSYVREGRSDDARTAFQHLLDRYADNDNPGIVSTLAGAAAQIVKLNGE